MPYTYPLNYVYTLCKEYCFKAILDNAQGGRRSHPQRQIISQGWTSLAEGKITPLRPCPGNLKQVAISRSEATAGCVGVQQLTDIGQETCRAKLDRRAARSWTALCTRLEASEGPPKIGVMCHGRRASHKWLSPLQLFGSAGSCYSETSKETNQQTIAHVHSGGH